MPPFMTSLGFDPYPNVVYLHPWFVGGEMVGVEHDFIDEVGEVGGGRAGLFASTDPVNSSKYYEVPVTLKPGSWTLELDIYAHFGSSGVWDIIFDGTTLEQVNFSTVANGIKSYSLTITTLKVYKLKFRGVSNGNNNGRGIYMRSIMFRRTG